MKITKTITINKPVDQVWDLVAHQFDKAHLWMGPIINSKALGKDQSQLGAPMEGRMCDLSKKPNGPQAKEIITQFSEQDKSLTFDVFPVNNPAIVPLKQNTVQMQVRSAGPGQSQVVWTSTPQLKAFAYPLYPLLRLVIPLAFGKLLQGLKTYAETSVLDSKKALAGETALL